MKKGILNKKMNSTNKMIKKNPQLLYPIKLINQKVHNVQKKVILVGNHKLMQRVMVFVFVYFK